MINTNIQTKHKEYHHSKSKQTISKRGGINLIPMPNSNTFTIILYQFSNCADQCCHRLLCKHHYIHKKN